MEPETFPIPELFAKISFQVLGLLDSIISTPHQYYVHKECVCGKGEWWGGNYKI